MRTHVIVVRVKTIRWPGDERDPIRLEYHGSPLAWSYPEHTHAGLWELTLVRHGLLHHTVDGQALEQPAGSLTVLRERDRHALAGQGVELVNLQFTSAVLAALARLPRRDGDVLAWALESAEPLWCRLPAAERPRWEARLDRLAAAIGGTEEMPCLLAVLAEALLACHAHRHRAGAEAPPAPGWLAPLQALLHDHQQPLPDLAGLRRLAGVSREHLARSLRRHLGLSPSQFLNRCRTQRLAQALLARPGSSVGELVAEQGFSSLTYAARCFRLAFGLSPQEWRRQRSGYQLTEARQWELHRERMPPPGSRPD